MHKKLLILILSLVSILINGQNNDYFIVGQSTGCHITMDTISWNIPGNDNFRDGYIDIDNDSLYDIRIKTYWGDSNNRDGRGVFVILDSNVQVSHSPEYTTYVNNTVPVAVTFCWDEIQVWDSTLNDYVWEIDSSSCFDDEFVPYRNIKDSYWCKGFDYGDTIHKDVYWTKEESYTFYGMMRNFIGEYIFSDLDEGKYIVYRKLRDFDTIYGWLNYDKEYSWQNYDVDVYAVKNKTTYKDTLVCDSYISPSGKFFWTNTGTFADTIQNIKGCDSIIVTQLVVEDCISKITQNKLESICVYPNPTSKNLNIKMDSTHDILTVRIKSLTGQIYLKKEFYEVHEIFLELDVPNGLYFIEITNSNGNPQISKVIVK